MDMKKCRIYFDVCCLNRPFDDLTNDRVRVEAEAVLLILSSCRRGECDLVSSNVIANEISKQTDARRLEKVKALLSIASEELIATKATVKLAEAFQASGITVFDSYHLAVAEEHGCDVFLTTDDRFLKKAAKQTLNIQVANPAKWILEVI